MALTRDALRGYLSRFAFAELFIEQGWDRCARTETVAVRDETFTLTAVAEKRGVHVFVCEPGQEGRIPAADVRNSIERELAKRAYEHLLIFVDAEHSEQLWLYPRREPGKPARLIPYRFDPRHATNESLLQKLEAISFDLSEEEQLTLQGVTQRLKETLDRDKLTKKFYQRFAKERDAFQQFLEGIPDEELARWYVAVLLNRLMFIYFIQEKGFLGGGERRYLQKKLAESTGNYYRDFLCPLFFQGFALPESERPPEVRALLGQVPYLNGGIFEKHQIEEWHGESIHIPNEAFKTLYAFFDGYHWHLDERPLRADNEINPDVLGYIFEKYINQKQMGAYYTKEDITGYISKNTIIPYLFDAAKKECTVAFENPGGPTVWDLLAQNPDRYIYDAVRHGVDEPLPEEIAKGVNPPTLHEPVGEGPVQTLELRKEWNKPAPPEYGLPTEIWRETVHRRERYQELKERLQPRVADVPSAKKDLSAAKEQEHTTQHSADGTSATRESPYFEFQAFDDSQRAHRSSRRLPHWRQEGVTYFVTWRLADAVSRQQREQWLEERS
ncbi:MAG: hypothetical protein ACLFV4_12960, partial [Candidatus Hydrogenedentota bacterium]